ncbi:MAG: hypothetical protein ABW000_03730, partial [Actinoplanes sp.]
GLDAREDVLLVPYAGMLQDPEGTARRLCTHIGLPYRPEFVADVAGPPPALAPLPIDPRVRELCDELTERLTAATEREATARG